jgi:hypothetical protein
MIRWQLHLLWPLVAVLLAMAAFSLYVFSHNDRLYRLKLLMIPALLCTTLFSFAWFGGRLGYGYPAGLPDALEYVAHKLVIEDNRKAWIDVMAVSRKPLERDARLHRLPWSQPLEDALKKARDMQQGGGSIELQRGRGAGTGDDYPSWVPRRVLPQDVMPKDELPAPVERLMPRSRLTT